jgi:transketolase
MITNIYSLFKGRDMDDNLCSENKMMKRAADTIRCLAMDAIQKADSGHPGMPMGCADFALVLWHKFLKHDPTDPIWPDRDRFVLSAGHGSMLLYSLLHLSGYDVSMAQIKQFRQWESITPGHPEFGHTPGVETTTGPLGQGFTNAVGMAMAERHLAEVFNDDSCKLVDHHTYVIVGDGDLMEGISAEAASFAGHHRLSKLICIYDSNRITIEGNTDLTFDTEDVGKRFESYGWSVFETDGHNMAEIESAIEKARKDQEKPSLIIAKTHIAHGSPNKHDTASSHGSPIGEEEIRLTKKNLGFPEDEDFVVEQPVYEFFASRTEELKNEAVEWRSLFKNFENTKPEKAELWKKYFSKTSDEMIDELSVEFETGKSLATRASSGMIIQKLAELVPNLIGGSADLAPSNKTYINGLGDWNADSFSGRNIHYGIREHAMAGIMNGMALHGGIIPFGGTFLVFSDYMRPSIRLSALMGLQVIYVFTHDSIFVGEDGPTHQPIEHTMALRLIPGLTVIRPSDANECLEAWKIALKRNSPTALILTRQGLETIDRKKFTSDKELDKGAYILAGEGEDSDSIIFASGSEVNLALEVRKILLEKNHKSRIISVPSWEIFFEQGENYINAILDQSIKTRLAVEAGYGTGWEKFVGLEGEIHSIDRFGASAPAKVLAEKYGFTTEAVVKHVEDLLEKLNS